MFETFIIGFVTAMAVIIIAVMASMFVAAAIAMWREVIRKT